MTYVKATYPKGQVKCFDCRVLTRPKEGNWQAGGEQQIFICQSCDLLRTPRAQFSAPPTAFKRH